MIRVYMGQIVIDQMELPKTISSLSTIAKLLDEKFGSKGWTSYQYFKA